MLRRAILVLVCRLVIGEVSPAAGDPSSDVRSAPSDEGYARTQERLPLTVLHWKNGDLLPGRIRESRGERLRWSSPLGPPTAVDSGTLCQVRVIVAEQRPIGLAIPILKSSAGL